MLKNYLKISLRSLWRSKVHSFINIAGLSLGIACCLLIVLFVKDELTFDTFHSKADRIYRGYVKENYGDNQEFFNTVTPFPLGPTLQDNLPEIEHQVRINPFGTQVKSGENQFSEEVTIVGEHFFEVFDFRILKGKEEKVLSGANNVVITERTAEKYFGKEDPINKIITIQISEKPEEFLVKAVVENPPINSSIRFNMLISDLNYPKMFNEWVLTSSWFNVNPETYVLLKPGVNVSDLVEKFPSIFKTAVGEEAYQESNYTVGLQALTSIHLDTSFPTGIAPVSNPRYSYILSAVAILILFVACINFVTLSVGRSLKRAKEVGIRKVVGALRGQLITQFIGEAVLITVVSLVLGFFLALISLSVFNTLAAKELSLEFDGFTVRVAFGLIVVIGLIAGSYPAFVLSNFRPVAILKGSVQGINSRQGLRKVLVGVQLVLSVFLVSSTLIIRNQLDYLQNKNLGFNREQLAVVQLNVPRGGQLAERVKRGFDMVQQFKGELSRIPDVAGVCGSSHDFANGSWTAVGYTDVNGTYRNFNLNVVEPDYFPVLQMEFAAGKNFEVNSPSDTRRGVIVNEAFAKELQWDNAIGNKIPGRNFGEHEVIGVVKDFNYASLYTRVEPLVLVMDPAIILQGVENININNSPLPKLLIRLKPGNMAVTIDQVKEVWNKLTGGEEFAFTFVDQALAAQYASDQNLGKIIRIATFLAILIGSLGLYGLASLAMQNRTKEIGIRKVMGATDKSLLLLLSKDYIYMVIISSIVSIPITWYLMRDWLAGFEYRVSIGADVFIFASGIALVITVLTIGYQAVKTSGTQPAETLKYE